MRDYGSDRVADSWVMNERGYKKAAPAGAVIQPWKQLSSGTSVAHAVRHLDLSLLRADVRFPRCSCQRRCCLPLPCSGRAVARRAVLKPLPMKPLERPFTAPGELV